MMKPPEPRERDNFSCRRRLDPAPVRRSYDGSTSSTHGSHFDTNELVTTDSGAGKQVFRGGFGRVEILDDPRRARKTFDPDRATLEELGRESLARRFVREGKTLHSLQDLFTIPVIEAGFDDDPPWFDMPVAEKTLSQQIQEDRGNKAITADPLFDVLNALEYLHESGYVHRDLKPANVLLHDGKWKLADFGLVRASSTNTTRITRTHEVGGTERYMAPEQARDLRAARAPADIYAFGCILHDYLHQQRVPHQQIRPEGAGELGEVIQRCTAEKPRDRYSSIAELRDALGWALVDEIAANSPEKTDAAWAERLVDHKEWKPEDLDGWTEYLLALGKGLNRAFPSFRALDPEAIKRLWGLDPHGWAVAMGLFCDWCRDEEFSFQYTDTLAVKLRSVFQCGDTAIKVAAACALASMGRLHNRFYVMWRLVECCGPSLEGEVAARIAAEMLHSSKVQDDFSRCVDVIGLEADAYHPAIALVLGD